MKHINSFGAWVRINEAAETTSPKPHFHYSVNPMERTVLLRNDTQGTNPKYKVQVGPLAQSLEAMSGFDWHGVDLNQLEFAANCALYHPSGETVGVQKSYGKPVKPETPSTPKAGNYGDIPYMEETAFRDANNTVTNVPQGAPKNGVLFGGSEQGKGSWSIVPTPEWGGKGYHAMGSGPILILNGKINGYLDPASKNLMAHRAGVGVDGQGMLHWVMMNGETSFWDLAVALQSHGCTAALFCDATVSQYWLNGSTGGNTAKAVGPIILVMKS